MPRSLLLASVVILACASARAQDPGLPALTSPVVTLPSASLTPLPVLPALAPAPAPAATMDSNLRYRLSFGDFADPATIVTVPGESRRGLRIVEGGEQLLRACRQNSDHWQNDSILFRLGHRNPGSTVGCRERVSPSLHMVFYETPDGSREAWAHFDLHGPRNIFGHATEVMRNRLSFGHTSEHEVYRGLAKAAGDPIPLPKYDLAAHTRAYIRETFSTKAVAGALTSASTSLTFRLATGQSSDNRTYLDRVSTNLIRNATRNSIEFGVAAFLQQDMTYQTLGEGSIGRRATHALYSAFFVPGRQHDELAFPRIAAAVGTPWVMRPWHPGRPEPPNPWVQSAFILGRYVLQSYWAEFKPDVKEGLSKMFGRD